jgi:hypothetical protein
MVKLQTNGVSKTTIKSGTGMRFRKLPTGYSNFVELNIQKFVLALNLQARHT